MKRTLSLKIESTEDFNNFILTAVKTKVRQADIVNQPNAIETISFELASHHPRGDGN